MAGLGAVAGEGEEEARAGGNRGDETEELRADGDQQQRSGKQQVDEGSRNLRPPLGCPGCHGASCQRTIRHRCVLIRITGWSSIPLRSPSRLAVLSV